MHAQRGNKWRSGSSTVGSVRRGAQSKHPLARLGTKEQPSRYGVPPPRQRSRAAPRSTAKRENLGRARARPAVFAAERENLTL